MEWLSDTARTTGALLELQEHLELDSAPERVECYDISNTQGTNSVASMVVFEHGKPKRSDYKRFQIKTVKSEVTFLYIKTLLGEIEGLLHQVGVTVVHVLISVADGEHDPGRGDRRVP